MIVIGGKLKVVEPVNQREDIFTTPNTLGLFDLYKTREEAIKSFEEDIQPESWWEFSTWLKGYGGTKGASALWVWSAQTIYFMKIEMALGYYPFCKKNNLKNFLKSIASNS